MPCAPLPSGVWGGVTLRKPGKADRRSHRADPHGDAVGKQAPQIAGGDCHAGGKAPNGKSHAAARCAAPGGLPGRAGGIWFAGQPSFLDDQRSGGLGVGGSRLPASHTGCKRKSDGDGTAGHPRQPKWVCNDDSFKFDLPANMMPPGVHKVSYPLGDPASYTFEIPFGGGSRQA
jgi:hypothetical protein